MLYIKAYNERLQQCIVKDTADNTEEKVGVSKVREVVSRGIQIPGVYADRITPVTEEQAVNQKLALLKLIYGDIFGVDSFNRQVWIDCSQIDRIILPNISYKYKFLNKDVISVELAPDWVVIGRDISCFDSIGISGINIVISKATIKIKDGAFKWLSYLTGVVIPDSITSIGKSVFGDCFRLENIIIPDSVMSIGACAFSGCKSLKSIVIPDSVINIGECAFYGCRYLESIVISDSVTSIGAGAFSNCRSLESIDIPDSVEHIEYTAFEDCPRLVIQCHKGSYAEQYAIDNDLEYEILG